MNFIGTGLRELGLKVRRQRTRMALRHVRRQLKRSEISLGREGTSQAASFPEVRAEIVSLKKLEQEQKEVAVRIAQVEEGLKQIETDRRENSRAQQEAISNLEAAKKPISLRRDEARSAANVCDRELGNVEGRLQANDTADRELLKKVAALQALAPPPDDLDVQTEKLAAKRARLPEERAEIVRAREGSAEACRRAKQKLVSAEEELAEADKNISRLREEYEAKDRALNEKARSQQDTLRDAKARHQHVEQRKDPAYLNIGRHLATRGISPPSAPQLLHDVLRHRQAVDRHVAHTDELKVLSQQIDKQHLRKFYFAAASVIILAGFSALVALKSAPRREWLPQETDTILSLNTERIDRDESLKRWRNEEFWRTTWPALLGDAAQTPSLRVPADTARLTRAFTTIDPIGAGHEFSLLETRGTAAPFVRQISTDRDFEKRAISGLPLWQRANFTVARIGPKTLAVGTPPDVDQLVRVRLGMSSDLPPEGQLLERFHALDPDETLRLISSDPVGLERAFHPLFSRELLIRVQLIGLGVSFQNPIKGRLLLTAGSNSDATELAKDLQQQPQQWLQLPGSDLPLFVQPPEVKRDGNRLEVRFDIPENSARLLLQRLARTDTGIPNPTATTAAQ